MPSASETQLIVFGYKAPDRNPGPDRRYIPVPQVPPCYLGALYLPTASKVSFTSGKLFILERPEEQRPAGDDDRRYIKPARGHHHARGYLIAVRKKYEPVQAHGRRYHLDHIGDDSLEGSDNASPDAPSLCVADTRVCRDKSRSAPA